MASKPAFHPRAFHDFDTYKAYMAEMQGQRFVEEEIRAAHPDGEFTVPGYCWLDGAEVDLIVDYMFASSDTPPVPNWRERLVCPACRLNNRQRATIHLVGELGLPRNAHVYLTEQVTPVYSALKTLHPKVVGSEFLGVEVAPGAVDGRGIRHEDITRLSFPDSSLDAVFTFDVLEHVPGYKRAIAECARVLRPGGVMLFSIPFLDLAYDTRSRASVGADGTLVHHHPPVYHGDPVTAQGVLCYQDFGWDLLDTLREAGFEDAAAIGYRSVEYGYLGGLPLMFQARKSGPHRSKSTIWESLKRLLHARA